MIKVYYGATGKMEGTSHISCASRDSQICKTVCKISHKCYAKRYQSLFPTIERSYRKNGEELTSHVHDMDELPLVNTFQCRFNAFGELFTNDEGTTQLENYVNIAKKNDKTKFGLWSHNYETVESYFKDRAKPKNLRLIRSTNGINIPILDMDNINPVWDGVFNVITRDYSHEIDINCGNYKCIVCPVRCYTAEKETIANEYLTPKARSPLTQARG